MMKAVHYEEPFKVSVKEVPLPKIEHPDDAIIKVTTAGQLLFFTYEGWLLTSSSNLRFRPPHVPRTNGSGKRSDIRYHSQQHSATLPQTT